MGIETAFFTVNAPRWSEGATVATSSTAATLNLTTIGIQTPTANDSGVKGFGAPGKYVTLCAMTTDCWIVFADTSAHAGNINDATAGTNQTTFCWPLTAGIPQSFFCPRDYFWLGYITASAAGTLTIYISSNPA